MQSYTQSTVPELTLSEAVELLGSSRKTVKGLIEAGLLRVRFAGRPDSLKPRYRIPLDDVLSLRNGHRYMKQLWKSAKHRKATKQVSTDDLKHISLEE